MEIQLPCGFEATSIHLLSPNSEEEEHEFDLENGLLKLTVQVLYIWDVLVIE